MQDANVSASDAHYQKDIDYHQEIGSEYHEVVVAPRSFPNQLLFAPIDAVIPAGGSMLDLGAGTGHMLLRYAPGFSNADGVDHSPAMLASAQKNLDRSGITHVKLHCRDLFEYLAEEQRSFELVTCVGCLHHLRENDIGRLLQRAANLLKPEGCLVVAEPIEVSTPCPEEIAEWNAQSLAAGISYSKQVEEPDEAPIDHDLLVGALRDARLEPVVESRTWEILPRSAAPGWLERRKMRKMHRRYGATGNVLAIAARRRS